MAVFLRRWRGLGNAGPVECVACPAVNGGLIRRVYYHSRRWRCDFPRAIVWACLLAALPLARFCRRGTPNVSVQAPWMRYLLPNIPAGGYMVLKNTGDGDAVLTGASSPDCGTLMLHKSQDSSGMAMMMDVPSVTVPAGGSVTFASGGYHLMCMQPKMHVGERVPVTLISRTRQISCSSCRSTAPPARRSRRAAKEARPRGAAPWNPAKGGALRTHTKGLIGGRLPPPGSFHEHGRPPIQTLNNADRTAPPFAGGPGGSVPLALLP